MGLAAVRLAPDQIGEAARVQQLDAHEDRTGAERPAGADDGVRRGEAPAVLRDREQHQARQAEHTGQQQDGTAAERVGQAVLCEVVAHEWRRGADGRAMTQTSVRPPQSSSVAERLCAARQHAGLSLDEAATTTGLLRSYVAALEAGRRRPLPREVDRLARAYGADLSDLLPARRPVEVDEGRITVAGQSRQLRAAADEREVYAAYLFLLYAVRGAEPGQRIPLRSSDVELLMQVVGEDASTIEHRLVQLMGCSPDEASRLGSVLLRHRALTAAVGAAAALTWVAVVAPGVPADVPRPAHVSATPLSGSTSSAAYFDADAADEQDALPVDGVVDGGRRFRRRRVVAVVPGGRRRLSRARPRAQVVRAAVDRCRDVRRPAPDARPPGRDPLEPAAPRPCAHRRVRSAGAALPGRDLGVLRRGLRRRGRPPEDGCAPVGRLFEVHAPASSGSCRTRPGAGRPLCIGVRRLAWSPHRAGAHLTGLGARPAGRPDPRQERGGSAAVAPAVTVLPETSLARPPAAVTRGQTAVPETDTPTAEAALGAPKKGRARTGTTGTRLVIVESATKARMIQQFLGPGYVVEASVGHIRDLPRNAADVPAQYKGQPWARLGVDVDNDFQTLYVVSPDKKGKVAQLKELLKSADELLLATDEDREGEAIAWHLLETLKPKVPVRRMVFHEITPSAIQHAVETPRELDRALVDAQETRRVLDRLYGYEVSPVLWKKVMPRLSAGRVQSVATRVVVTRERERMAFRQAEYWDVEGHFVAAADETDPTAPRRLTATLHALDGRRLATGSSFEQTTGRLKDGADVVLLDEASARNLAQRLEGAAFSVRSTDEKPYSRKPYAPFMTSTLQQEGGRKLRFSAQRVMQTAQRLYENGYITYMRTDSTNLSETAVQAARSQARDLYGPEYVPDAPRRYASKSKNAQEAHEAIRPSGEVFRTPGELARELSGDELRLYELIWQRTVASQMADARGVTASVRLGACDTATARTPSSPPAAASSPSPASCGRTSRAPTTSRPRRTTPSAGCRACRAATPSTSTPSTPRATPTSPPARYTEASLVKRLEELGIGRPSTYASIITTVQDRGYVWKKGSALVPTWLAFAVVNLMEQHFGRLVDYGFTVSVEDDLDTIAGGDLHGAEWLSRFYFGSELGKEGAISAPGRAEGAHRQEPRRDRRPRDQHHPDRHERGRPARRRARRPLRAVRPGRRGRGGGRPEGLAAGGARPRRAQRRPRPSSWRRRRPATGCSAPTRRPATTWSPAPAATGRTSRSCSPRARRTSRRRRRCSRRWSSRRSRSSRRSSC